MKLLKEYNAVELDKWSFAQVQKYRNLVFDRYIKFDKADQQMIAAGLKLINAAYDAAVKVSLEGVELNEEILSNIRYSEEDLQTITRYRALLMSKMIALPPAILKTMSILKKKFGNF